MHLIAIALFSLVLVSLIISGAPADEVAEILSAIVVALSLLLGVKCLRTRAGL